MGIAGGGVKLPNLELTLGRQKEVTLVFIISWFNLIVLNHDGK